MSRQDTRNAMRTAWQYYRTYGYASFSRKAYRLALLLAYNNVKHGN